jgi:hypothetical protein
VLSSKCGPAGARTGKSHTWRRNTRLAGPSHAMQCYHYFSMCNFCFRGWAASNVDNSPTFRRTLQLPSSPWVEPHKTPEMATSFKCLPYLLYFWAPNLLFNLPLLGGRARTLPENLHSRKMFLPPPPQIKCSVSQYSPCTSSFSLSLLTCFKKCRYSCLKRREGKNVLCMKSNAAATY